MVNHYCKNKNPWTLIGFLFLHNFRIWNITASLKSECALLSKHTNPQDILSRNGRKIILSILKYSLGIMMFPKIKGIRQIVKKPSVLWDKLLGVLGGTYYSRLRYRWEREGFPMIAAKCIHQGLRRRRWDLINKHLSKSHTWFLKNHFLKNPMLLN